MTICVISTVGGGQKAVRYWISVSRRSQSAIRCISLHAASLAKGKADSYSDTPAPLGIQARSCRQLGALFI